jgi:hypothetical protein
VHCGSPGRRGGVAKSADRLFAPLKRNRHGHRDYLMALVTFLHGLRVGELVDLMTSIGAKTPFQIRGHLQVGGKRRLVSRIT